jgi:DNA-binding transcriptional LysR family regulator
MIDQIEGDFLQWLRGFYWVAQKGSATQAALEMGRSQPTISYQLKRLEHKLGVTLFDRSSGRMELTPEGRVLLQKSISVFEIIREMADEVTDKHLEYKGRVIVAATHAVINCLLPKTVISFRATHPAVNFDFEGGDLETILHKVDSAEADLGIAHTFWVPNGLACEDLFRASLVLIAPKNNRFRLAKDLSLDLISRTPFLSFPNSSTIVSLVGSRLAEQGLKLNTILTFNNYASVKRYVALGLGISILDDFALAKDDAEHFDVFPLDHLFGRRTYSLVRKNKKYLSPATRAFIRAIKKGFCAPALSAPAYNGPTPRR